MCHGTRCMVFPGGVKHGRCKTCLLLCFSTCSRRIVKHLIVVFLGYVSRFLILLILGSRLRRFLSLCVVPVEGAFTAMSNEW